MTESTNLWVSAFKSLKRNRLAMVGLAVISLLVFCSLTCPFLVNNVPLMVKIHRHTEKVPESLLIDKFYFPSLFNYREFNFQGLGEKSVGRGFERWVPLEKGKTARLKMFYQDENITLLFPPIQFSPTSINIIDKLIPPSLKHPMGTDDLGRDILTRILYGARTSLGVGVISQIFALLIGLPLGMLAGYFSNRKGPRMGLLVGGLICILVTLALFLITGFETAFFWGLLSGIFLFSFLGGSFLPFYLSHHPLLGLSAVFYLAAIITPYWQGNPTKAPFLIGTPILAILFSWVLSREKFLPPGNFRYEKFALTVDDLIMWLVNVVSAFPFLLLVIAIVATVEKPDIRIVFVAIGMVGWVEIARLVRGQVLTLKEKEFIEAVRSLGASDLRILVFHILPNILAPIIVSVTLGVASAIMIVAGLSFLGLGVQPPYPTWGGMINDGRAYLEECPWIVIFPGVCIMLTVFSFNLLGDGLRDALDPKTSH